MATLGWAPGLIRAQRSIRGRIAAIKCIEIGVVILGLSGFCGCNDGQVAAAKGAADQTIDGLAGAASEVAQQVRAIEWSELAPEGLKAKAGQVVGWCLARLQEVTDSETAAKVAGGVGQVLDAGGDLLKDAVKQLPDRQELADGVARLRDEHGSDTQVGKALDPVLARLQEMLER